MKNSLINLKNGNSFYILEDTNYNNKNYALAVLINENDTNKMNVVVMEYYFENGQRCAAGVVEVDGSVYYINSGCRPVTGKYFVSANKGNGILEEGYYTFDANGVLISG